MSCEDSIENLLNLQIYPIDLDGAKLDTLRKKQGFYTKN